MKQSSILTLLVHEMICYNFSLFWHFFNLWSWYNYSLNFVIHWRYNNFSDTKIILKQCYITALLTQMCCKIDHQVNLVKLLLMFTYRRINIIYWLYYKTLVTATYCKTNNDIRACVYFVNLAIFCNRASTKKKQFTFT